MADLRDPWTDIYYYDLFYPSFISRKIDLGYEKAVLEHADIITTVGPSLGKYFESKVPGVAEKIKIVHNGYDESDFENLIASTPAKFTISYTGTISESYPVEGFIKAIVAVIEKGQKLSLKFTGHISDVLKERFISAIGNENLEFIPYSDHKTVVGQMLSSSMQLLVLARDPRNRSFLPGKLFEYIASGKPVLCLGPADGFLKKVDSGNALIMIMPGKYLNSSQVQ
jgi:glycosyltransferase involved in cell wall biosynthesis